MTTQARKVATKIAIAYIIIGSIWIILSDKLSRKLAEGELEVYIFFQQYKGWFFVFVTGITLYILVYNRARDLFDTQHKLVNKEYELQASNEHYQSLFKHNPDAVFEISKEGKVRSVNPEGEAIMGYSRSEIGEAGMSKWVVPEDVPLVKGYFHEALHKRPSKFEFQVLNRDGDVRILRSSLLPIVVNEQVSGVFMIARDITNYRRDEERMIESEKMSVIGQMAAAVAHEIRNPLTSLKGFVQLMQVTKDVNEEHLDVMMSEINRINLISSEMLILGKKQHVSFQKENMTELLKQVVVLMKAEANLHDITIQLENEETHAYVMCDANQLKQVFINIIKNGVEAMSQHGMIHILLKKQHGEIIVTFKDNGVGMSPERINQIGTPFYSTKEAGTGLGLAVCYKIMERHQGFIVFESEVGKGTTVTVTLKEVE
ncbi:ATP-binding protein [Bacillus sp. CGMCC 1.16541]|uniref:ATP-binding protein n=1 Tax=Bacillus sp. CGMCC 1.16541 TaxID=2185143 RepID=UPI000D727D04|nr:ATP-binding protein [Bacillus sp. CGMCC 1.16541]